MIRTSLLIHNKPVSGGCRDAGVTSRAAWVDHTTCVNMRYSGKRLGLLVSAWVRLRGYGVPVPRGRSLKKELKEDETRL